MSDLDPVEARLRREDVDRAIASTRMEGGEVPAEVAADLEAFVAGEIDADELTRRTDARYPVVE